MNAVAFTKAHRGTEGGVLTRDGGVNVMEKVKRDSCN